MLITLFLSYAVFRLYFKEYNRIYALIVGITCWTGCLYIITEILSTFLLVDKLHMIIYWGALSAILLILILKKIYGKGNIGVELFEIINKGYFYVKENKIIFLFACICIGIVFLALFTVPYNWDSMSYHLARIAHWKQNRTIAHYFTGEIRQLTSPVLAEIVDLHVYILHSQNDSLLNLLQAFSYIMNSIIVYGISRKIRVDSKLCYLGVMLYLCMPIAFAEGLSTQVDEYATFWLLSFVYVSLDFVTQNIVSMASKMVIWKIVFLSIIIAMGYLTKPSILIAVCVFALWIFAFFAKNRQQKIVLKYFPVILGGVFLIVIFLLPEIYRNMVTFHAISAPIAGKRQLVGTLNPAYLFINALKNISLNLPNIYLYNGEFFIGKIVYKMASMLQVDINDPSISEDGREFSLPLTQDYIHDSASNPVIMIGFFLLIFFFLVYRIRHKKTYFLDGYVWCAGISILLFCVSVRWEIFVNRYMLSYLALLCPAIVYMIQRMQKLKIIDEKIIITLFYFTCIVDLYGLFYFHGSICYEQHINEHRADGYFVYKEGSRQDYTEAIETVKEKNYQSIGLDIASNSYEYPIWAMLNNSEIRIEDVQEKENESKIYDDMTYIPDCIIVIDQEEKNQMTYHGVMYQVVNKISNGVWVMEKE